jgi:L-ascorbate metabolism protein UlaG (beta-lactamase superfamily)
LNITFFGHSAWGLEAAGRRVLIDPFPVSDEQARKMTTFTSAECDLVLVTHAGADHLGIALDLTRAEGRPRLVSDIAVVELAKRSGMTAERWDILGWNCDRRYAGGWKVRALETKHWSVVKDPYIVGFPLAFVVEHESEPEVRVMHLGDTSLFSDLALFGQLYAPTVALVGVGGSRKGKSGHMTPGEAALATLWLGAEFALPMHFPDQPEIAEAFCAAIATLTRPVRTWVPELNSTFTVERRTTLTRRTPAPSGTR